MYTIREKLAYSKLGKMICTVVRDIFYKGDRVHWVQQRVADWKF